MSFHLDIRAQSFSGLLSRSLQVATLGLLSLSPGVGAAERHWVEVQSPNFLVQGSIGPKAGLELAERLELLQQLLAQKVNDEESPAPTVVLAFGGNREFRRYSPWPDAEGVSAYFVRGGERSYIGVDASLRHEAVPSAFHEYLHVFAGRHFPGMPLWFQEGLAELYSNLRIETDAFVLGAPQREHLEVLRDSRWIPWSELLEAKANGPLYDSERVRLFYAQSWLLVHFLGDSADASRQLPVLLDLAARGERPRFAGLLEVVGMTAAEFNAALRKYSRKGRFSVRRVPRRQSPAAAVQVREVSEAESLARLGDLLAERPEPAISLARRHFERALRLDPGQRLALEGLARLDGARD